MQLADAMAVAMQLQSEYIAFADAKDSVNAARHLSAATLNFDGVTVRGPENIDAHYAKLWAPAELQRHLVSNFRIESSSPHRITWICTYQRFALGSASPRLTTLGEYRGTADFQAARWLITALTVHREWHQG